MLANDEVIDGKSERGGHPVIRRPMMQWMLRITAYADELLAELDAGQSMAGQVERTVLPLLHTGTVTIQDVARRLGLSSQTLYRALRAEGTTFEALLAALRHRFAQGYLAQDRASLSEIAYLLGYSDVSAFSRAFKRREGVAPGAWRRANRSNQDRL